MAPIITFRAENNVEVKASLSDGFFQIVNPTNAGSTVSIPALINYTTADSLWTNPSGYYASFGFGLSYYAADGSGGAQPALRGLVSAPQLVGADPQQLQEYYALYQAYAQLLNTPVPQNTVYGASNDTNVYAMARGVVEAGSTFWNALPGDPFPPSAPTGNAQLNNPQSYLDYLQKYEAYVVASFAARTVSNQPEPILAPLVAPTAQVEAEIPGSGTTTTLPPPTDNTPSPIVASQNALPLLSATLTVGRVHLSGWWLVRTLVAPIRWRYRPLPCFLAEGVA